MGWLAAAPALITAGSSLLGAWMQGNAARRAARYANQPTTTTTTRTPYDPEGFQSYLDSLRSQYDPSNIPDFSPTNSMATFNKMFGSALSGEGGFGSPSGSMAGRPGFNAKRPNIQGMLPGIEGWRPALKYIEENARSPEYTQYMGDVLGGKYLEYDSNPYLQDRVDALGRQHMEQGLQSMSAAASPFVAAGGGLESGAGRAAQQLGAERWQQGLGENLSNFLGEQYQFERGAQQQVAQAEAAIAQQLIATGADLKTAYDQAKIAVASLGIQGALQLYGYDVQKYGIDAGMYNNESNLALGWGQLAGQMAGNLDQLNYQANLAPFNLFNQYSQQYLGATNPLASSQTVGQGPQVSPGYAAILGAWGGAESGAGLGRGLADAWRSWYSKRGGGGGGPVDPSEIAPEYVPPGQL